MSKLCHNANFYKQDGVQLSYSKSQLLELGRREIKPNNFNKYVISIRKRKRGRRGGVKERLRRTGKPPLPTIILSNVRSIRNKIDNISGLCKYDKDYEKASILCFTESWLGENDPLNYFELDNFTLFRLDRDCSAVGKQNGGGLCLYINKSWCKNCRPTTTVCKKDIELIALSLRPFYLPREFPIVLVIAVYIPPDADYNEASKTIEEIAFDYLKTQPDAALIILGDFNQCPKLNSTFYQHVTVNTRRDKTIDLCYTNIKESYRSIQKSKIGSSDHNTILLLPIYVTKLRQQKPVIRNIPIWSNENIEKLQACFDCTIWDELLCCDASLDDWADIITSYLQFCCDLCIQTKQVKIYGNNKPWVTKRTKYFINMKKIAHMKGDTTTQYDAEKQLRRVIKEDKIAYKNKMERKIKHSNPAQAWQMIKTMGGAKNMKTDPATSTKINPNELNEFYCRFDVSNNNNMTPVHETTKTSNETDPPVLTEDEVSLVLKVCKKRKAPGPDNISGELLSECHEQLSVPMCKIYQRSIDENKVPTQWKTSKIIPIAKKSHATQLNDFRPVALTSIVMKCLEKIMKCQLLNKAYNEHILDPLQFAYQHNLGVEDALLEAIHRISRHLDESPQNFCRILYVDFSSAFNAMNTNILIQKLHQLNFPHYLINWYHDFLTERPQHVKLGAQCSTTRILSNGCPQGCVSSPLLYIIYTNDCVATQENCSIIKYADDTAILGLLNDAASEARYKRQVENFCDWCATNQLELNISKTKEQFFDFRKGNIHTNKIVINNQEVETVSKFKYLGVVIDSDLKFRSHTTNVINKCNQRLYILRKLNSFDVKPTILVQVYKSLVLSVLNFGISVWYSGCGVKEKGKLQKIVNTASSIVNRKLDSLAHLHATAVERKAFAILTQQRHPLRPEFNLLPSGKRYREIKCRTNRHKSTFVPTATKALNRCYCKQK